MKLKSKATGNIYTLVRKTLDKAWLLLDNLPTRYELNGWKWSITPQPPWEVSIEFVNKWLEPT